MPDIPWYVWTLVLILLAPWLVRGLIYIGLALFTAGAFILLGVVTVLEPAERRYNRSKFAQRRRQKKLAKRRERLKTRGPR